MSWLLNEFIFSPITLDLLDLLDLFISLSISKSILFFSSKSLVIFLSLHKIICLSIISAK